MVGTNRRDTPKKEYFPVAPTEPITPTASLNKCKPNDAPSSRQLPVQSLVSEPIRRKWVCISWLTENKNGDLLIRFPPGPFKTPVTFLAEAGA